MRFAFKTSPQDTTYADMLSVWQAADDIEVFESGWLFDHFYPIFSDSTGPCLEGWTTLAALAQATTRLRLAPLLTRVPHAPPARRRECGTTCAALAQATTRLRLGTLVTGVHYRHPAVLANMAAAVDI